MGKGSCEVWHHIPAWGPLPAFFRANGFVLMGFVLSSSYPLLGQRRASQSAFFTAMLYISRDSLFLTSHASHRRFLLTVTDSGHALATWCFMYPVWFTG